MVDRDRLVAAATEMNEVMGLDDPEIDVRLVAAKLEKQIRKAAELITEDDSFTKPTTATLKELGLWPPKAKKDDKDDDDDEDKDKDDDDDDDDKDDDEEEVKPSRKPKKPAKDDDDEEEEAKPARKPKKSDDEDEEPADLPTTIANTGKLTELKAIVEEKDEFKKLRKSLDEYTGLQGPKQLKLAMYKILGVEPPKPAPRAASGKKRGKGGLTLAAELLEAEASQKEIYKAFMKLYAERGQEDEEFVKGRADIYIKLAKGAAKKEEAPAKKSKKSDDDDED